MADSLQSITSKQESDRKYYIKNKEKIKEQANLYYYTVGKERRNKKTIEVICEICGTEFLISKIKLKRSEKHLCSKECTAIFLKSINIGEKSYLWKGGITKAYRKIRNSEENKEWIKGVFIRDDYTCKKCNCKGVKLTAHHIFNFSKLYLSMDNLLWDLQNGITLCIDCHKEFHKIYGKTNNNINQLNEYINV